LSLGFLAISDFAQISRGQAMVWSPHAPRVECIGTEFIQREGALKDRIAAYSRAKHRIGKVT
jgi:hypothetical protein